jgi:hypothetical protein
MSALATAIEGLTRRLLHVFGSYEISGVFEG